MTDNHLEAKFASGLELDLGEGKIKIDSLLSEISKLTHVEKLLLYLKLPGETNLFRSQLRRDAGAESISVQWIKTHLKPDPNFSLLKKNVYENYKNFCTTNSHPYVSLNDFGKNLRSTMKMVHHRRLGRRGEALYAYAGVNYIEETKSFIVPETLKCNEFSKRANICSGSEEENIESDCDDSSEHVVDDDDDETCARWKNCVSLAVRSLILEWAEKVIDKNIKFKKYKELAEHLFNQNFVNKNSREAYILLSDMRQSGRNKIILPKAPTSCHPAYDLNTKPTDGQSMQNQTKQKLFNTLTKRDELRQQKKRAKLEESDPKMEQNVLNSSKSSVKARALSNSCEMTKACSTAAASSATSNRSNVNNIAPKRPSSAHQKVILPKLARIQDSGSFKSANSSDASSVNQFLLLPSRATNHSTIAPVVIALVQNQSVVPQDQILQIQKKSAKDQERIIIGYHDKPQDAKLVLNSLKSSPLTFDSGIVENVFQKHDQTSTLNCASKISPDNLMTSDNLNAPDVLKKVYKDSKFIASVLNDAASNPFGSQKSIVQPDNSQLAPNVKSPSIIKNKSPTVRNKFSNQTVSTLLNRRRILTQNLPNYLSFVKLTSDKRPVAKILQDKREKSFQVDGNFQGFQLPGLSPSDDYGLSCTSNANGLQAKQIPDKIILSMPDRKEANIQQLCKSGVTVCYMPANTSKEDQAKQIENTKNQNSDRANIDNVVVASDQMSNVQSKDTFNKVKERATVSEPPKAVASKLFQILNEPVVHPDGSVVFQKNSNPSEILSWFESQGNSDTSSNKFRNGVKKVDKLLLKNSISQIDKSKIISDENMSVCSPSIFLNDKTNDDSLMPYNNSFAQNFTLQQLSEVLKVMPDRSGGNIKRPNLCSPPIKNQESRPVSVSIMTKTEYDEHFRSSLCSSRPSTVASTIIDDVDKSYSDKLKNDGLCFTPVQMVESISPRMSGVQHPQPLVAASSVCAKTPASLNATKLNESHWNSLAGHECANKNSNSGSFVPYTNNFMPTSGQCTSKNAPQHKENDPIDSALAEDNLFVYLSNERQRHSSAHEISCGSNDDPWIFNCRAEAEIDAILQQGFGDSVSGSSSNGQILMRCHSEPAKYRITATSSPEDVLMENDDENRIRDDKIDELQNKDINLVDIGSNSLGIYFEEEDIVNFDLWNGSNSMTEIVSPKLSLAKIHESDEYLTSDKSMEFLAENDSSLRKEKNE